LNDAEKSPCSLQYSERWAQYFAKWCGGIAPILTCFPPHIDLPGDRNRDHGGAVFFEFVDALPNFGHEGVDFMNLLVREGDNFSLLK
jgi:hypothetical protein